MPEFTRSRLNNYKNESNISRKTIAFGVLTFLLFIFLFVFGLPILIKFSVFLGEQRNDVGTKKEVILPPLPPRLVVPFEATPSAKLDIGGFAEEGVMVELYKNGELLESQKVNEKGEFKFPQVNLNAGPNTFFATAYLRDTVKSENSKQLVIVRDESAPELDLTSPDKEMVTVDYADYDVVGKTERGVTVMINNRLAPVNDNGEFKLKIQLSPGKNEFEIKAKDAAGNETKKKITVTYDI